MNSGIAVRASEKLWMVSASNATDPVAQITTTWTNAVTISAAKEIFTALRPRSLASSAVSMLSAASWLCGRKISAIARAARRMDVVVPSVVVAVVRCRACRGRGS